MNSVRRVGVAKTKVKIAGTCSIYVEGFETDCPFCRALIRSGEEHRCYIAEAHPKAKMVPKKRGAVPPGDPSGC